MIFRNCEKCVYCVKDREAMLRCYGKVAYLCAAHKFIKIGNPKWDGIFCKNYLKCGKETNMKKSDERKAQVIANETMKEETKKNPNISEKEKKNIAKRALGFARRIIGAVKEKVGK